MAAVPSVQPLAQMRMSSAPGGRSRSAANKFPIEAASLYAAMQMEERTAETLACWQRMREGAAADAFAVVMVILISDALFSTWYTHPPRWQPHLLPALETLQPRNAWGLGLHALGMAVLCLFVRRETVRT